MKTWKLVSGILSIVFFLLVLFESCADLISTILQSRGVYGFGGFIVAIAMISGGIVSIATRESEKNGGNIALIVLFGLAALVGLVLGFAVEYGWLIWTAWCLANVILAVIALVKIKEEKRNTILDKKYSADSEGVPIIMPHPHSSFLEEK